MAYAATRWPKRALLLRLGRARADCAAIERTAFDGGPAGANDPPRPCRPHVQFSAPTHACSRNRARRRATAWLCSWHTRDSLTSSTAPISRRFSPRS